MLMFNKLWSSSQQLPTIHATRSGYLLSCRCGAKVSGLRNHQSQVARCGSCQEELFVLAISPRPIPHGWVQAVDTQVVEQNLPNRILTAWTVRLALLSGTITAILIISSFLVFQSTIRPDLEKIKESTPFITPDTITIWSNGPINEPLSTYIDRLARAMQAFNSKSNPEEFEGMRKLLIQAQACQAISSVSIEDYLIEGISLPDVINAPKIENIKNRMFVFDTNIFTDNTNTPKINDYKIIGSNTQAQFKLGKQKSFNSIVTTNERRVVFAIQLKQLNVSINGWEAEFEDDSAVLIEDPCFLDLLGIPRDDKMLNVIKSQKTASLSGN